VAVILENAGGGGGTVAAPVARKFIDDYFARTKALRPQPGESDATQEGKIKP
jgi:cell division protein FtsI/penicillin-binding protein 2